MIALHENARLVLVPVELRFEPVDSADTARATLRLVTRRSALLGSPLGWRGQERYRERRSARADGSPGERGRGPDREPIDRLIRRVRCAYL